jgi:hypothetical protein
VSDRRLRFESVRVLEFERKKASLEKALRLARMKNGGGVSRGLISPAKLHQGGSGLAPPGGPQQLSDSPSRRGPFSVQPTGNTQSQQQQQQQQEEEEEARYRNHLPLRGADFDTGQPPPTAVHTSSEEEGQEQRIAAAVEIVAGAFTQQLQACNVAR